MDDERLLGAQTICSSRAHSRLILPAIELMLGELKKNIEDVDVVAVSRGPGSFTGVRVGMALAKGICAPGHPKLVTVSALEALAHRAYGGEAVEYILPLLNARQGEVYGALYQVKHEAIGPVVGEEFAATPEELVARLPGRCVVAGEGALVYKDLFENAGAVLARRDRLHPGPEQVALLGAERASRGEFVSAGEAAAVYLREASVSKPKQRGL